MAQKTDQEDAEFKETIVLCAKCNVACNSSCQKCFASRPPLSTYKSSFPSTSSINFPPETDSNPPERTRDPNEGASPPSLVNRCSGCRRKVGLTGFRCRCGEIFCANHRYSDRHDCTYDYKVSGREAIARENPVVKAAKIVRI